MNTRLRLKICAYLLSLLGLWSVTATEHFSSIWPILAAILVSASWFYEGPRAQSAVYRRAWMLLAICMIVFFPFDLLLSINLLLPAVHMSMFAQAYLLFNQKSLPAYSRIFLVSFAQILASSNLTSDLVFAIILALYCMVAVYGALLMQLLSGLGERRPADEKSPPRLFAVSLALTALLLPLTLVFFYSAPRFAYALVAGARNAEAQKRLQQTKTRTGFTTTVQLGSFGKIQEDQTLALRVEFPEGSEPPANVQRWRGGALNIYDGTTWSSSRDYFPYYSGTENMMGSRNSGAIGPRRSGVIITDERYARHETLAELDADEDLQKYVCYLEIPYTDTIFGNGDIKAIHGPFKYGLGQDFNRSFSILNRPALPEFITYTAYSRISEPSPAALRRTGQEWYDRFFESGEAGEYFRIHFLQTPPSLNPRIESLAIEVTESVDTPYDKVAAIQEFLMEEYKYSLDLGAPSSDDPLSHFMFVSRSGHCEYFATAMTLMTRTIGIPARLVKGFQRGEWNEDGRFFEVRQRHAHAWVEVYFPNHGWIEFDPSPRAAADEYFEGLRSPISRAFAKQFLALQIMWRKHIVGYNATRRSRLFSDLKNFVLRDAPRRAANAIGAMLSVTLEFVASHLLGVGLVAALMIAGFIANRRGILILPSLRWPTFGKRRRVERAAFYERMLGLLEKKKIVKPACMTPLEFLEQPALRAHPMYSDIEAVTAIYNRVRFGNYPLVTKETGLVNDILKRLRRPTGKTET